MGNIGHIPSINYQRHIRNELVDIDFRDDDNDKIRFLLETYQKFYALPNCLKPGKYIIQIGLYSENAKNIKICLEISWTGTWKDSPEEMFNEIVISKIECTPNDDNSYNDSMYRMIREADNQN